MYSKLLSIFTRPVSSNIPIFIERYIERYIIIMTSLLIHFTIYRIASTISQTLQV